MRHDPYTLVVAVDADGTASGELYMDDGVSFAYQTGGFVRRQFTFANNELSARCVCVCVFGRVSRVVVVV